MIVEVGIKEMDSGGFVVGRKSREDEEEWIVGKKGVERMMVEW